MYDDEFETKEKKSTVEPPCPAISPLYPPSEKPKLFPIKAFS